MVPSMEKREIELTQIARAGVSLPLISRLCGLSQPATIFADPYRLVTGSCDFDKVWGTLAAGVPRTDATVMPRLHEAEPVDPADIAYL